MVEREEHKSNSTSRSSQRMAYFGSLLIIIDHYKGRNQVASAVFMDFKILESVPRFRGEYV